MEAVDVTDDDAFELTETECDEICETVNQAVAKVFRVLRDITVPIVTDIPEEDLEPHPAGINEFSLRRNTKTSAKNHHILKLTGLSTTLRQRQLPDNVPNGIDSKSSYEIALIIPGSPENLLAWAYHRSPRK